VQRFLPEKFRGDGNLLVAEMVAEHGVRTACCSISNRIESIGSMRLSVQSRVCLGHAASMKHDVLEVVTVLACIVGVFFVETHVGSVSVALDTFEKVSFQGVEIEDLLADPVGVDLDRGDGVVAARPPSRRTRR
jgi:hypothetical protein